MIVLLRFLSFSFYVRTSYRRVSKYIRKNCLRKWKSYKFCCVGFTHLLNNRQIRLFICFCYKRILGTKYEQRFIPLKKVYRFASWESPTADSWEVQTSVISRDSQSMSRLSIVVGRSINQCQHLFHRVGDIWF